MYDMLPFPNFIGKTTEEQVAQITNYLIQFKETLEFILTNISTDNLSQDLVNQLNTLGADIQKSVNDREEEIQQMSNKTLSVADVLNSSAFKAAVPQQYLVSATQIQTSEEDGGINLYAIKDKNGKVETFTVKNGTTPNVEFSVNFDTGHLEYTTS